MGAEGTNPIESVFAGSSEMAARMRALDWSTTALGPVESVAARSANHLAHCAGRRLCDGHFLGPGLHIPVQRCLHSVNRNKAPVGAGPSLSRIVSRGVGFR